MSTLSNRLAALRVDSGLSLQGLADRVGGVTKAHLWSLERGQSASELPYLVYGDPPATCPKDGAGTFHSFIETNGEQTHLEICPQCRAMYQGVDE